MKRLYIFAAAGALIIDQWTKYLVKTNMEIYSSIKVLGDFFSLTYVENSGVAFGMLGSIGGDLKRWILSAVVFAAMILVTVYWAREKKKTMLFTLACSLITGGAAGNLVDRVSRGFITDFLEFGTKSWKFAIFNGADTFVTIGVGLFIIYTIISKEGSDAPGASDNRPS